MVRVKVWFLVGDSVMVSTFEAVEYTSQIKPGGVGLVTLLDAEGKRIASETFGTCFRISVDEQVA